MSAKRHWLVLFAIMILAGCARVPARWDPADLRLLDPAGDSPSAETDIIALYTRPTAIGQQVRVDFLDLKDQLPERVYLAFDTGPGGSNKIPGSSISTNLAWDLLVSVPSPETARFYFPDNHLPSPGLSPQAWYNYAQDNLIVTLPPGLLPVGFKFEVLSLSTNGLADSTLPIASDAPSPARAPLLLSFTDVLPANSPATALRRWDGAHTGPFGERHGLHSLLEAASKNHIPVALLDLRTPRSLSALNVIGGLPEVQQMLAEGLLILPEVDFAYPSGHSLPWSLKASEQFGLARSEFSYSVVPQPLPGYPFQFTPLLSDPNHLGRDQARNLTLIPMPSPTEQVDPDGLTIAARRALLEVAMSPDQGDLVSMGDSLPDSAWGDSDAAQAAMQYIAQHPWIRPLDAKKLTSFPTVSVSYSPEIPPPSGYPRYTSMGQSAGMDSHTLTNTLLPKLEGAPPNPLTDAAWDMYFALSTPSDDPKRDELQAQYLGQVGILLAASDWAASPSSQAGCQVDLDFDTIPECVLANNHLFAVFEKEGGRLGWLFSVKDGQPHQLVGGTEQFVVGLSDRSLWQVEQGAAADPHQIPGAFVDTDAPWSSYEVSSLGPDSLELTSSDGMRVKSFRLFADRLSAQYTLAAPLNQRFALTLDPWMRFNRGWGSSYYPRLSVNRATWSVRGGPSVSLESPGRIAFNAYIDTLEWLYGPEDPNQDFPPGHYLPFPMAVADYLIQDGQVLTLSAHP